MKHYSILFFYWILTFTACSLASSENRVEQKLEKTMLISEAVETDCTHEDVLKLREYKTLKSFYQSVHRWYGKMEAVPLEAFPNLNQKNLVEFFGDIDINVFRIENAFSKEYHFNKAPEEYTDSEECMDKLSITFIGKELSSKIAERSKIKVENHNCMFMLTAFNSFVVEDVGCSESQSFYYFVITGDEVEVLLIGGAG